MDHSFTIKVKQWLDAESHTEPQDILDGALMLLQLNRNRALYNAISRQPLRYVEKIRYELNKFLPSRLAGMTMDDVVKMESETLPPLKAAIEAEPKNAEQQNNLPLRNGKRPDHDQLPDNIQAIWEQNADRWKKIKETYNICLFLSAPCDRYEHLTVLKELWYKYKAEFDRYDSFKSEEGKVKSEESDAVDPVQLAKDISNAQKYISKNADALIELKKAAFADGATEKQINAYTAKREKVYGKLLTLIENNTEVSDALMAKLADGGITLNA